MQPIIMKITGKIGTSVIVKQGVKDVAFGESIAGWQGRLIEITGKVYSCVKWDSITLNSDISGWNVA